MEKFKVQSFVRNVKPDTDLQTNIMSSNVFLNKGLDYASYGQIAKTLDATLKVVIDFNSISSKGGG